MAKRGRVVDSETERKPLTRRRKNENDEAIISPSKKKISFSRTAVKGDPSLDMKVAKVEILSKLQNVKEHNISPQLVKRTAGAVQPRSTKDNSRSLSTEAKLNETTRVRRPTTRSRSFAPFASADESFSCKNEFSIENQHEFRDQKPVRNAGGGIGSDTHEKNSGASIAIVKEEFVEDKAMWGEESKGIELMKDEKSPTDHLRTQCDDQFQSGLTVEARDEDSKAKFSLVMRMDDAMSQEHLGPYPTFRRPLPEECLEVTRLLEGLHGPYDRSVSRACPTLGPDGQGYLNEEFAEKDAVSFSKSRKKNASISLGSLQRQSLGLVSTDTGSCQLVPEAMRVEAGPVLLPSEPLSVLDSLVRTILSQNTTDSNSRRAFAALKVAMPTWEDVLAADAMDVENAIRCGGLAEIKGRRIREILQTLQEERGQLCMEHLRGMSTEAIKAYLTRFKGVGPKTVACVLMFHLQREEFPVDTHVFHIAKLLGWVPSNADRERTYLHLNQRVPDSVKYALHCLMVTHGKHCRRCAKGGKPQKRFLGECPLISVMSTKKLLLTSS